MKVEETYIMIKPDGVQHGLVRNSTRIHIVKIVVKKFSSCKCRVGYEHYKDLQPKPFFPKLIDYITSGPLLCMAWEGVGVVASAHKVIGATNSLQAELGTIRGDLAIQT
ncbi:nucleoside diphosphate kinase 2, chloroplastic [Olea europaea subsp. europaea]|uniref:nucleoside-diphosphate kinase n=1 Tax=Olea europaea subsp. europaea TaxID=158383 RepID=A0A8S0SMI7_OLEEU|nr:nucleoside diphosphate kinase 2, chloroplastic [Olea europaea subsp. europaea]